MYRIDNATAISVLPVPAAVGPKPNAFFTKGNPATSLAATIVDDDWCNSIQEEICNVITGAGITLDKTKTNQLLSALTGGRIGRSRLAADTTFYVATTGNNSNSGLVIGSPWLTLQFAYDTIASNYDLTGKFTATLQIADGTYAPVVCSKTIPGNNYIGGTPNFIINGNSVTPANVIISASGAQVSSFAVTNCTVKVQNLKVQSTNYSGLYANFGNLVYSNIVFGVCAQSHVQSEAAAVVFMGSSCSIVGAASAHFAISHNSVIVTGAGAVLTLTGTPAFSTAFVNGNICGTLDVSGNGSPLTFTGTATGPRYALTSNSVVFGTSANASFFPGNSAGSTSSGGAYI